MFLSENLMTSLLLPIFTPCDISFLQISMTFLAMSPASIQKKLLWTIFLYPKFFYHFSWTIQSCLFIYCPNYLMSLLCFFKGDILCLETYVFSSVLFAIRKTLHLRFLIRFCVWLCWLTLQFTLSTYSTILTHLMPLISSYTPWKYHKTRGFLIFSGGIFLMTSF